MSDEPIIKRKLLLDGDGTGEDKRILAFLRLLPKWILNDDTGSFSETTLNKLLAQLGTIVTNKIKCNYSRKSIDKQAKKFKILQTTYQENIKIIRDDIENQRNLLKRAKTVKKNRIEYDLLLAMVNKQPSRKEMGQKIECLEVEINKLQKEKENLNQRVDAKVKQCYVLSTSANSLKSILTEGDVEWENQMDLSSHSDNSELEVQVIAG